MKANPIVRGFEVTVGDVIRPIRGQIKVDERTSQCELYGPDDFRQGYDAMTVTAVYEETFTAIRPYWHIFGNGMKSADAEAMPFMRRDGFAYELLSRGF